MEKAGFFEVCLSRLQRVALNGKSLERQITQTTNEKSLVVVNHVGQNNYRSA
jgi:hypothetical protein